MLQVFGIDIYEHRGGADLGDGFGGGDEGVGYGDDFVTGPDAGSHEGKAQGVGAGVDADAVFGVAEFGELFFKALHVGTTDKHAVFHGFGDHGDDFGFD